MFDLTSLVDTKFSLASVKRDIEKDKKLTSKIDNLMQSNGYSYSQALYHLVYPKARTTCNHPDCDNTTVYERNGGPWGYRPYCSAKCSSNDPKIRKKTRKTLLGRYGVSSPLQNKSILAKKNITSINRHGVANNFDDPKTRKKAYKNILANWGGKHHLSNKGIREKIANTNTDRYGGTTPSSSPRIVAKIQKTNLKRYGVKTSSQAQCVKDKQVENCLEKRGVSNPMQDPELFAKQQISRYGKHEIDLGGRDFSYQGYEGFALQVIVNKLGVPAENIRTNPRAQKKIWYYDPETGKQKRYYADIRIKHKGKDISVEVKSTYTVGLTDKSIFSVVKQKAKAAASAGVDLRVWVVEPKKRKITRVDDLHKLSWGKLQDRFEMRV